MKRVLVLFAVYVLLSAAPLRSQPVPPLINYQGQVLGADGSPLATGDYELTFRIFDAAEGGALIWGPLVLDGAGGVGHGPKIPVVQGYFNVMLGPVDAASRQLSGAFQAASRFLEIKVGTNNPISPRQQILSAPYAVNAANAATVSAGGVSTLALTDGAVSAVKLSDNAVTSSKVVDGSMSASKLAQEVLDRLVPAGTIVAFGGTAAPAGWTLCDGSAQNGGNPTFSALFTAIGKAHGNGDGSVQGFNLPDLRGRTVVGTGQGANLSNRTLAAKMGTETEGITQVPAHTHGLTGGITTTGSTHQHAIRAFLNSGSTRIVGTALGSTAPGTVSTQLTEIDGGHTHGHNLAVQSAGGAVTVNNMQPSIVLNYIIKL
ncbi:MAG TPA: tail fiber protein [Verrucomicrobiae bacterium]|nr:tail fiber protein [Verrucomicrobiae bacterium]